MRWWEIGHHAEEQVLGDLERGQILGRDHGRVRGTSHGMPISHEGVALHLGDPRGPPGVSTTTSACFEDDVGGIGWIALMHHLLALAELRALGGEAISLSLAGSTLANSSMRFGRHHQECSWVSVSVPKESMTRLT
jgi:hypothetical protein